MDANDLTSLAALLRERNRVDAALAALIGRPPEKGHLDQAIPAGIFDIALNASAAHKGIDGHFLSGPLTGRSVNVKYYGKREGLLALALDGAPDYYLVLTGPKATSLSSKGLTRPFVIDAVYLFGHAALIDGITAKHDPVATSVRAALWRAAEIYPTQTSLLLPLTAEQRESLTMFGSI